MGDSTPKVRHKSFTYKTDLHWMGNRAGMLSSDNKSEFRVSSPPEFKGEEGTWTPEDLFVAAIDVCTMMTFEALAIRNGIAITSYKSHAEGLLEFVDGGFRFTNVVLRPTIVVEIADNVEAAKQTLEDADRRCLVTNSIDTPVAIEATVTSKDSV